MNGSTDDTEGKTSTALRLSTKTFGSAISTEPGAAATGPPHKETRATGRWRSRFCTNHRSARNFLCKALRHIYLWALDDSVSEFWEKSERLDSWGERVGKQDAKEDSNVSQTKSKLEDDLEVLFRLPLAEFTAARNALAGRLKKEGRGNEADFVKALVKPSITAWAVNQLYWMHRKDFDRLIATGDRVRQAQASHSARKMADIREALDARRKALSDISDLATAVLKDASHNPTLDAMRRITSTLEAMSVYAAIPDGPRPGRLTHDVDPPGFESLASFTPGARTTERTKEPASVRQSHKSGSAATSTRRKTEPADNVRKLEETRQARVAAAKVSLQEAKSLLTEARARAQSLEAAQKQASAEAKDAEKHKREAEERFEKAKAASEEAARHAQSVTAEVRQAAKALEDAKRTVEKASKELEKLFREPPAK